MATATAADPNVAGGMTPRPFRVVEREQNTVDTWTLSFEPADGAGPVVAPGQFMMVYVFGIGEVPISVSAPPVVLTVRAVGAVSRAICASELGTVVGLRGPFGTTWPVEAAAGGDVLVVAGGIGLAPLRPVVLHTLAHREAYKNLAVVYGARTPDDLLYPAELVRWGAAVTVDVADTSWNGPVGFVAKLVARTPLRPDRVTAFVCGPEIMMTTTVATLLERGVAPERIQISMERHMDCGVGLCGHCQLGPTLICRDGPVYAYSDLARLMEVREL
jgi:NAD(P)H-flavin reductase